MEKTEIKTWGRRQAACLINKGQVIGTGLSDTGHEGRNIKDKKKKLVG